MDAIVINHGDALLVVFFKVFIGKTYLRGYREGMKFLIDVLKSPCRLPLRRMTSPLLSVES